MSDISPGTQDDAAHAANAGPIARIDRWLWAARFFKTRTSAAAAVSGGKVQLNGQRTKPAKTVRVGDRIDIRRGDNAWRITVLATAHRRGPALEAQTLYEEDPASIEQRVREREERRARRAAQGAMQGMGRPTKRDRRRLERQWVPGGGSPEDGSF